MWIEEVDDQITSADMIPWWQWMLSEDWPKPLLASMKEPNVVIPTVSIRDCLTGFLEGMKMEFMGLSESPLPTWGLLRITVMFSFWRSFFGPMPLRSSSWGLPTVPEETITSLRLLPLTKARCRRPHSSLNTTPIAFGLSPVAWSWFRNQEHQW